MRESARAHEYERESERAKESTRARKRQKQGKEGGKEEIGRERGRERAREVFMSCKSTCRVRHRNIGLDHNFTKCNDSIACSDNPAAFAIKKNLEGDSGFKRCFWE